MKSTLLLIFIIVPIFCFADMGTCYCVEAEIEDFEGELQKAYFTIRGYDFWVETQNGEYVYSTTEGWVKLPFVDGNHFNFELKYEPEFSNYILSLLGDSL